MTSGEQQRLSDLPGQTVYDSSGQKIGKVGQIWLDDETGQPEWTTVNTGMFGNKESFMPMDGLESTGDGQLRTQYSKDQVKNAPQMEPSSGHLDTDEEERLYSHYGREGSWQVTAPRETGEETRRDEGPAGQDVSGPTTDDAMTRSEERLRAGKERHETGKARLRKYVVTENEEITVPVTHEEVRLEREPITEENRDEAMSGPEISEEEHEVTLHEERPVTDTETVPVERVRMSKEQVSEDETVSGQVRKERIESEGAEERKKREE